MQYDNIYKLNENKKDNLKTQNLITSTQSRFPNNTKFINVKQRCKKKYKTNPPKVKKRKRKERERERERVRNNILCVRELCIK